jgi:hypothetical protein
LSADGGIAVRAGGPQTAAENAMAALDCTKAAATEAFPTARWVCLEWQIDAVGRQLNFWLDGQAQTEIGVADHGTACAKGAADAPWEGPSAFTKIALDWEAYGTDSPQEDVWFDEFALGTSRIGCPSPSP